MRRLQFLLSLVLLSSISVASSKPTYAALPRPVSSLITGFVQQTDAVFGYKILRPANWESLHLGDVRGYFPAELVGKTDRVLLQVVNYQTLSASLKGNVQIIQFEEFKQNPSLDAWVGKREQEWKSLNLPYTLERRLPNTAIYVLTPSDGEINVLAYSVVGGQPFVVGLYGFGSYSNKNAFIDDGLFQDFVTMAASVASSDGATNSIDPPLIEASGDQGLPSPLSSRCNLPHPPTHHHLSTGRLHR